MVIRGGGGGGGVGRKVCGRRKGNLFFLVPKFALSLCLGDVSVANSHVKGRWHHVMCSLWRLALAGLRNTSLTLTHTHTHARCFDSSHVAILIQQTQLLVIRLD